MTFGFEEASGVIREFLPDNSEAKAIGSWTETQDCG